MIDFQSGYILRPVNPVFIYFSLFCALLLNLMPIGNYGWVPDWLIVCIVFWNIHQHRYVSVITAFILGLMMDVLRQKGLEDSTLVVFVSDNGAPFINSKTTLYDAGVKLPLIIRNPTSTAPGVVNPNIVSFKSVKLFHISFPIICITTNFRNLI